MIRVVAALLLAWWASPSHAVAMAQCPDNVYWYPVAVGSSYCPSVPAFQSIAPDTTQVVVTGTVTALSGTVYASVRLNCTEQQWRNIALGIGDESSGSDTTVTSGSFSITLTGLAEDTVYCLHIAQYANDKPTKTIRSQFTTTSSTPPVEEGDEITGNDDWFFCDTGNNGNSGRTPAEAKQKPAQFGSDPNQRIDTGLAAGDDMWFCSGGVWNTMSLDITRAGTENNWSETGCYWMDGATPRKCVDGQRGLATNKTKPIFRGGVSQASIDAATANYPASGFPREGYNSIYDAVFYIASTADYHILSHIRLENGRYGTVVASGAQSLGSLHHVIVDGLDLIQHGKQTNIVFADGVSDMVARNNTSYRANLCNVMYFFRFQNGLDTSACTSGSGFNQFAGTTVTFTRGTQRYLVENNTSMQGVGEGMNVCFEGLLNGAVNNYGIVRNNVVVNSSSTSFYLDGCAHVVVENNIALGGNSIMHPTQQVGSGASYESLHVGSEERRYPSAINHVVRNNLFIGALSCLDGNMFSDVANNTTDKIGAKLYGNTCIGHKNREMFVDELPIDVDEWDLRNNVAWNQTLSAAAICQITYNSITGGYNRYTVQPSNSNCQKSNDSAGAMGLTQSTYSWWTNIANVSGSGGYPTLPTFADANPAPGSALIGAGTPLTSTILDASNYGFAFQQIAEYRALSTQAAKDAWEAAWECALCVDALGATRANPPSIGAVE